MSKIFVLVAFVSILNHAYSFKKSSFRHDFLASRKVTQLADLSALHDSGLLSSSLDTLHHFVNGFANPDVHLLPNSFNIADSDVIAAIPESPVSVYSKVDKTGFIGGCADVLEKAIDLSHDLMQKLGVKDTYGYSIILLTIFSKLLELKICASKRDDVVSFTLSYLHAFLVPSLTAAL